MTCDQLLDLIARGRTDLVFDLLRHADWAQGLSGGANALQWFIHYGDVTALRAALDAGGDLAELSLDAELNGAAFHGHWRMTDFLLARGASATAAHPVTGETPLHSALTKAGRPACHRIVELLLAHGADPNAATTPGVETGAFMRDVRTCGETPLHRAAAYAGPETIARLVESGADRTVRDANGDTPLSWASRHLRPGAVLQLLQYGPHTITAAHVAAITSDHGAGWGYGIERHMLGDFLAESLGAFP